MLYAPLKLVCNPPIKKKKKKSMHGLALALALSEYRSRQDKAARKLITSENESENDT